MILETERLTLRPLRKSDAEDIARQISDWEVVKNLAVVPHPYDLNMAHEFIERVQQQSPEAAENFAVVKRRDGVLIGSIGLRKKTDVPGGGLGIDIGYWFGREHWGQGYGSEAVSCAVAYGFEGCGAEQIWATLDKTNVASRRVLEKAGLRAVAATMMYLHAHEEEREAWVLSRTRGDWLAANTKNRAAKPVLLVAAVALIDPDGRVLVAQRPEGKALAGLWEFPGGKIEPGETPEAALIRELKEELSIDVTASCLAPFTFASHAYDDFHLLMPLFVCRVWEGIVRPREGQATKWLQPAALSGIAMPPADAPIIPLLRDFL